MCVLLRQGLARPTVRTAFATPEGPKALVCWVVAGSANLLLVALRWALCLGALVLPARLRPRWRFAEWLLPFRRFASRTTIFRRAIDDRLLKGKGLSS